MRRSSRLDSPHKYNGTNSPVKKFNKAKQDLIYSRLKATPLYSEQLEDYQPSEGLFDEGKDIEGKSLFQVTPNKRKTHHRDLTPVKNTSQCLKSSPAGTPKRNGYSVPQNNAAKTPNRRRPSSQTPKRSATPVRTPKRGATSQTPKRSTTSRTPKIGSPYQTPKRGTTPRTPKIGTPSSQRKSAVTAESTSTSRSSSRLKLKQELASLNVISVDSDPEDSDEMSEYEDTASDGNTAEDELLSDNEQGAKENGNLSRRRKDKISTLSFHETYFSAQRQQKTTTSNRTLSSLKVKQTNIEELQVILNNSSENHLKHQELLLKHYKSQFRKWMLLLRKGFNILLYGIGSKQKVLNEFCKDYLEDSLYIIIEGFFPTLNIKQILNTITEDALEYEGKFSNVNEQVQYLRKRFSKGQEELFLIFHNIDGMRLRNVKTQTILSSLAAVSKIHFLCSIDHINSPLIWNQIMLSQFKWVWFDATTFEPYVIETSYEDSIFKDQSSHLLLSSLLHVYNSLTPNSQGVFRILAKYQQEQQNSSNCGIAFHEWYQECREEFLVNSEITMQAHLSEFKNHKLLTSRKSIEGIELWYIPVDSATLDQFLETCK